MVIAKARSGSGVGPGSRPRGAARRSVLAAWTLAAVASAGPAAASGAGAAGAPADPRLETRLQALEVAVARLRGEGWLNEQRAEEIRSLAAEVIADADTRATLVSAPVTSGYQKGFFLETADGQFHLEVTGQLQNRWVWNRRLRDRENDTISGFEIRRAKLKLNGFILGPELGYTVGTAVQRSSGIARLQSFNIRYRLSKQVRILLGRARPPLTREESISSKRQLAAERSLVVGAFGQSRTLGINVRYSTDTFRLNAGFMDASTELFGDARWRASARAELLLSGDWDVMDDFTSFPDDEPATALGAGVLYQSEDLLDPLAHETKVVRWSADFSMEFGGANLFASIVGNHLEQQTQRTLDQFGVVLQGGVFLNDVWEFFGRYEWGDADGVAPELSVVTFGFNRYISRHALKWTIDLGFGLNEIDRFWSSSGAGFRRDRPGQDGQVTARVQFQMLF